MKTFIFGAGASVPFFEPRLNTQYLTDKVCNPLEWDRVINKRNSIMGNGHPIADVASVIDIIGRIKKLLPNANFEQIAEVIDKICSYGFSQVPSHNMMNLLLAVFRELIPPINGLSIGAEWGDIPFLYREIIAEAILDLQNNHKVTDYDWLLARQKTFIEDICNQDGEVSVMSLNYDDCVYDSLHGLGFEKGFRPTDPRYLSQLDVSQFMRAPKVVYFPHGHLKFQFVDNENVTFWHDSNLADHERWEGLKPLTVGSTSKVLRGKFAYNYNTFLSTGQTKDDGLNQMPYAIYYQRLAIDLYKSNRIYVVGYSFGDDHINRLLKSFLKLSPDNRIYIIDYYTQDVTLTNEHFDNDNIITKIYYYLGTEWQVMYDSAAGTKVALNQQEVDRINQNGYGELFPQVIFYKKGYHDFLNEFENVLH